jgi:hypothetical protein
MEEDGMRGGEGEGAREGLGRRKEENRKRFFFVAQ